MTVSGKKMAGVALGCAALIGTFAAGEFLPLQQRYSSTEEWFLDIEPKPVSLPHNWNRFFPYEEGEFGMLHIPDRFEINGHTVEIVQGSERDRYDVGKEIFLNPVPQETLSGFLYKLHMLAADMVVEERYETRSGTIAMAGYSVDAEFLSDGRLAGKITLYRGAAVAE